MTMPQSQVSYHWQQPIVTRPYLTGVSLHSHTSLSLETLNFVQAMCAGVPFLGRLVAHYDRRSRRDFNLPLNFDVAHWRPPLLPRMAFDLEHNQIQSLGLAPLVSLSDHDDIQAPLLLRTVASARHIPVSVEWTTPFGLTAFHLGIHNLPAATASAWMQRFAAFTAAPSEPALHQLLTELDAIPTVLIILNHPQWDLYSIGDELHQSELARFLTANNALFHAFELNGLRHARENRQVVRLANRWNQLLLSGGDRHGLEPNAIINLTNATTFSAFVQEVRVERKSHVLFLAQYARPWEQRILESTLDAISDHPHFSPGWQRWDERAFHPDVHGVMHSFAEMWPSGRAPLPLLLAIHMVRLFRHRSLARLLGLAFPTVNTGLVHDTEAPELA